MTVHGTYGIFDKMLMTMEDMDLKALYDGNFYHVCTNGLEQVTLLKDEEDFRTAWNYLALSAWRTGVEIYEELHCIYFKERGVCKNLRQAGRLQMGKLCMLFFNNKTSVPQLSRVLGLPRKLIQRIMST